MNRYFDMTDDVEVPGRWFLSDPVDRHGNCLDFLFSRGKSVDVEGPVRVGFARTGAPVDYSELAIERVPVVHVRVAEVLARVAPGDIQIVPVEIEGYPDQFCIINAIREIECIDDEVSEHVEFWGPEGGAHRAGKYRDVRGLRIQKAKVNDARIFRTWGWHPVLIVSEEIKHALEQIGTVGVRFDEV